MLEDIDPTELEDTGILVHANQTVFHPIGMALRLVNTGGRKELKLMKNTDDDDQLMYEELPEDSELAQQALSKLKSDITEKHTSRKEALGFVVQDLKVAQ